MARPTTTQQGITLSLGSYSLSITRFGNYPGQYPRLSTNYTQISHSISGAASRTGVVYRPPAIWTFEGRLTQDQYETLIRMEALYWNNRTGWIIYDYTNYYGEATRTRAIAPNSTEASDGTTVLYYPQWRAEPTNQRGFERTESSKLETVVAFQFTETTVVTP